MSLYQFMVNRYINPVIERHRAEGRAEGIAEGQAQRDAQWDEWLRRHPDIAAGFDEPPPSGWPHDDKEIC